jgi:flagellar basal body-associated protein FliL
MSKKTQTIILTVLVLALCALALWMNWALDRVAAKAKEKSAGKPEAVQPR